MAMQDDSLIGMKEIADAAGFSWKTVEKFIKDDNFPATKLGGRWASDRLLIAEWKRNKILANRKKPSKHDK